MNAVLKLERPGANLAALCLGNPEGEPVLALHGWLDNGASFAPLSGYLPDHYIIALDFPGHGESGHRPAGTGYLFVDYVADVAFAVRQLGWRHFHLIGHSLGANVALAYSAVFPEQVGKLVLLDGVGPTSGSSDDTVSRLRRSVEAQMKPENARGGVYPDWDALVDARCRASPISREGASLLVRRNAKEVPGGIRVHSDRRLRVPSPMYLSESMVEDMIRCVASPTLVLLAEQGAIITRKVTHQRIGQFRNATMVTVPGNHHLHLDLPGQVADVVAPFLGSSAAS